MFMMLGVLVYAQSKTDESEKFKQEFRKLGLVTYNPTLKIPSFETFTIDGKRVLLSDLKGKIVFLNFWATWCPPCRREMPSMEKLHNHFKGKDLVILAVSIGEDPVTVEAFLRDNPYTFSITCNRDGSLGHKYASRGVPTTYILNREGDIIASRLGAREWDDNDCISLFTKLLE